VESNLGGIHMKKVILLVATAIVATTLFVGCKKADSKEPVGQNTQNTTQQSTEQKTAEKKFNYYTAEQLKTAIEKKENIYILDIQVKEEYDAHHIKGAVPTYAYPVKTDEDKAKIDKVMNDFKDKDSKIIVICPKGQGGAERTVDYLNEKKIKEDRIFILEKGQAGWSYSDLLENK